jgi:hypothetical protein
MPTYLATVMWDCLAALQFAGVAAAAATAAPYDGSTANSTTNTTNTTSSATSSGLALIGDKDASFRSLAASGRALEEISDRARDLIFELVRRKADDLLEGMEFVKWEVSHLYFYMYSFLFNSLKFALFSFQVPCVAVLFGGMSCSSSSTYSTGSSIGGRDVEYNKCVLSFLINCLK